MICEGIESEQATLFTSTGSALLAISRSNLRTRLARAPASFRGCSPGLDTSARARAYSPQAQASTSSSLNFSSSVPRTISHPSWTPRHKRSDTSHLRRGREESPLITIC